MWFWEIQFPPPISIFLELELFWWVPDCLSRKFFWDLAKLNLIIQNVCKSQKPYEIVYKSCKMLKLWHNLCDFEKFTFHLQSVFSWSWNFSDKSQIVCQGNFFDISQSSIWLYKMYAKVKNPMKWCINRVNCWELWHNICDFEKSTFHLQSVFSWSWNFSDKSQIVCQGKFCEISQSSIWLYKMYAKVKNHMKWYINHVNCWELWHNLCDFEKFTFHL